MDSSTAPKKKTSPVSGDKKVPATPQELQATFLNAAVTMGWQLAVAVVVPIVGGYELDQYFHRAAVWEIIGFVIAALGFYGVLKYTIAELNTKSTRKGSKS